MSDLWFSPYELHSAVALNARSKKRTFQGALIRKGSGFACLHPWPELGDRSLQDCLANFDSPLMKRALACAEADGHAREEGVSLFQNLNVPISHATLPEASPNLIENALLSGFTTIKVKANQSLGQLKTLLNDFPQVRWRIDFNATAQQEKLRLELKNLKLQIDFIEDPFPFEASRWRDFEKTTSIALANDRAVEESSSCGIHIIKPAANDPEPILARTGRKVFTSYMDHPLGQTFAAWQAALAAPKSGAGEIHGLQTHHLFEPNPFTEALGPHRPQFQIPSGPGLGFQDLLDDLPWKKIPKV